MCGTAEFIAPEIVAYDLVSGATDMWAIGKEHIIILKFIYKFTIRMLNLLPIGSILSYLLFLHRISLFTL